MIALLLLALSSAAGAALPPSVAGTPLPSLAPMLEKILPAIVNVSTTSQFSMGERSLRQDPGFPGFFGPPEERGVPTNRNLGSGVIVDADNGYIVTNQHVIANAGEITVTLRDRRRLRASLVGSDPDADVALIRVEANGLTALALADSDRLRVGDFVVAIGNPFGLGQTVTSGIISALGRSGLGIEDYENFIQTDAAINPGSSGGALVNLNGDLIGISTAILTPKAGSVGIGFAIPSRMVRAIVEQLLEYGNVQHGYLGIEAEDLGPQLATAFGIEPGRGAVITKVDPGSPAERAGLAPGDLVSAVNGQVVESAADMHNSVGLVRAGETLSIDVVHEGRRERRSVTITTPVVARVKGADVHWRLAGAVLSPVAAGNPFFEGFDGILILEIDVRSPADKAGLMPGDLVRAANRQTTRNVEELRTAIGNGDTLLLNVQRGEQALLIMLQ